MGRGESGSSFRIFWNNLKITQLAGCQVNRFDPLKFVSFVPSNPSAIMTQIVGEAAVDILPFSLIEILGMWVNSLEFKLMVEPTLFSIIRGKICGEKIISSKLLLQKKTLTFPETCLAAAPGYPLSFSSDGRRKEREMVEETEARLSLLESPVGAPY